MAFTRHIRDLLDATTTNSSTSLKIVSTYISAAKTYWEGPPGNYTASFSTVSGVNGKKSGWLAVFMMGDDSGALPNYAPTSTTYDMPNTSNLFLGNFPDTHGVYASESFMSYQPTSGHIDQQFGQFKNTYSDSGLRHLAHQVQFAKGTRTFTNGGAFITGGTNLPGIQNQTSRYITSNIAFSNFRGLTKDGQQSNYIWGDNVSETTPITGPISIGNAAVDPGGSGA